MTRGFPSSGVKFKMICSWFPLPIEFNIFILRRVYSSRIEIVKQIIGSCIWNRPIARMSSVAVLRKQKKRKVVRVTMTLLLLPLQNYRVFQKKMLKTRKLFHVVHSTKLLMDRPSGPKTGLSQQSPCLTHFQKPLRRKIRDKGGCCLTGFGAFFGIRRVGQRVLSQPARRRRRAVERRTPHPCGAWFLAERRGTAAQAARPTVTYRMIRS